MTGAARFQTFTDAGGERRYRILGGNGEIMATSEGYTRDQDAERGLRDLLYAIVAALVEDADFIALVESK